MKVNISIEAKRGCGYRKPGGLYLVSDGIGRPCCKLPVPLSSCPHCGGGIKFTRGFTWITTALFKDAEKDGKCFKSCPLASEGPPERWGMLWVGERFYPRPEDFCNEAKLAGVSKRIARLPNGFELGKTWVALAHRKAVFSHLDEETNMPVHTPGIFRAFVPKRIEYIVHGNESRQELKDMKEQGITLVKVVPDYKAQTSFISE